MLEPQQGMSTQEIIDWALYAEKSGYGYIFRSDHLLPIEEERNSRVDSPECWVTLGAIAAKTKKIKFGSMVSPVGFRNPSLLARMACTLDSYSKGRMRLGLGAGWYEEEYKAHGYEFPPFKVRRKQVEEAYKIVRQLTDGKRVDFNGEYYSSHVECLPTPAKGRVHLIGGGRHPRIVETLASYVDEWNLFNSPAETFLKLKEVLARKREGKKVEISQMGSFLITENKKELNLKVREFAKFHDLGEDPILAAKELAESGRLCGTVEQFVEQLNSKIESGIEKFYFQILDPTDKEMVHLLTDTLRNKF